jgi:hydroxymethylbilane synthase
VFISRDGRPLDALEPGARIGTSSLRRRAFLLNRLPHLDLVSLRGNVETRIRKIETENLAGAVLAAAGIRRLGFTDRVTEFLEPDWVIPAIGQGALALEARVDDPQTTEVTATLNHGPTAMCVQVERAFLRRLGGGCQVPIAAHCRPLGDQFSVTAAVVHPDGNPMVRCIFSGATVGEQLGVQLADDLIGQGAAAILRNVLSESWEPGPCA